jgi:hypothetical protein
VGVIGGAVLGLAAFASQVTASGELALVGTMIVIAGLVIVGYYAVRDSGHFANAGAARTGAVAGLICGLMIGIVVMSTMVLRALDPAFQGLVIAQNEEWMRSIYSPQDLAQIKASGVNIESVYPFAIAFAVACCGALLPLSGMGLGAIGGAFSAQAHRTDN